MGARTVEIDPRSGFCFGVVRAISMAEEALAGGSRLVSLGDIVHNEAEVARLERLGLRTADDRADIAELAGAAPFDKLRPAVLIRAHGEPPATYEAARRAGVEIVDATCPVVAALGRTVRAAFREMEDVGGQVVIFGRRGHAEVRGLLGQRPRAAANRANAETATSRSGCGLCSTIDPNVVVIEGEADLAAIDFARPICFLAQTTGSLGRFHALADEIRRRAFRASGEAAQVVVRDTICRQVADREAAIGDFARRHDVVIFVCGEKSSNGQVLFDAVRRANPRSHKVVAMSELRAEWFADAGSVGVCGATSTPYWLMAEIAGCAEGYGDGSR